MRRNILDRLYRCLNESSATQEFMHYSQNVCLSLELHSQKAHSTQREEKRGFQLDHVSRDLVLTVVNLAACINMIATLQQCPSRV